MTLSPMNLFCRGSTTLLVTAGKLLTQYKKVKCQPV